MNYLLIIITLAIFILGIFIVIVSDGWGLTYSIGGMLAIISGLTLVCIIQFLLLKPLEYKSFKVKYETISQIQTNKDDIRDATFTQNLIEINTKINHCKEYKDNLWIGIFENEKICEYELLKNGGNNDN